MKKSILRDISIAQNMNDASRLCHAVVRDLGWWTDLQTGAPLKRNKGELIALIHSEISEVLEAVRKDEMDRHLPNRKGEEVELADALIRIFDYAGAHGLDIGGAMVEKLAYNKDRADHKQENRRKTNGKKF